MLYYRYYHYRTDAFWGFRFSGKKRSIYWPWPGLHLILSVLSELTAKEKAGHKVPEIKCCNIAISLSAKVAYKKMLENNEKKMNSLDKE